MSERIGVFCGSSFGKNKKFREVTRKLGKLIAKENIELVYGGGNSGLMGEIANSVLEVGGKVIGVIPESLKDLEMCHTGVSKLIITETMHQRKEKMYELADYFIVLPGGIGTIDEFTEVLTLSQLCVHNKACAVINIDGYFDDFLSFLNKTSEENFFKKEHLDLLIVETSLEKAIQKCRSFVHPNNIGKWVDEIKEKHCAN